MTGGLADQAIASLGNFALNVILARSFAEHEYGAFALVLSVILFLNTLHQAFVTFPLSVEAAAGAPERIGYFLTCAVVFTLMQMPLLLAVAGGVSGAIAKPGLFAAIGAFLIAWQLQEVWRRGLIARSCYPAAIAGEMVRYIFPLLAFVMLARIGRLSLGSVFWLLALFSLLACPLLFSRIAAQWPAVRRNLKAELRGHWQIAAPLLGANVLAALSSQWFLWLLAWSHDLASSAVLVALANIVGFSNPVIYGMENILVPEVSRRRGNLTFRGLLGYLRRRGLAAFALVAPFMLAIAVWPGAALHLFYGAHKSYGQFTLGLQLLAAAYAAQLGAAMLSATLRGYRATPAVFKMQLYPALIGLTAGSWLTLRHGVIGACLAMLGTGLIRLGIAAWHVWHLRHLTASNGAQTPLGTAGARQGI